MARFVFQAQKAAEDKELVGVEDLEHDRRWPKFSV